MKKLIDVLKNPSGFDSMANYSGEIPAQDWLVVVTRSRDSDVLTESNWEVALSELGGESESVQVFRFGHWACGWWEALCVQANTDAERIGEDICERIEDYPILDEMDFSEKEMEEANRVWKNCYSKRERLKYIRENRSQFDFHNFSDLMAQIRGEYFSGYASELID